MPYQYPVLIGLILQRLWEAVVSRECLTAAQESERAELLPEPLYPAMVVLHVGWLVGCWVEVLFARAAFHSWVVIPMLFLWALSLGLRIWMLTALGSLWNVRLISRPEQPIVTSGPYRFLRHPNYLAVILEITAVPLLLGAYWTALVATLANGVIIGLRIRHEEAYLFSIQSYREAFSNKCRLLPGVF